jgi:hypothetical protein
MCCVRVEYHPCDSRLQECDTRPRVSASDWASKNNRLRHACTSILSLITLFVYVRHTGEYWGMASTLPIWPLLSQSFFSFVGWPFRNGILRGACQQGVQMKGLC